MTSQAISAPGFTGAQIDRADHIRNAPDQLAAAMGALSSRLLMLDGIDPHADEHGTLVWGSMAEAPADADLAFLGFEDGKARFVALPAPGPHIDARSRSAWRTIPLLRPDQAALYAAARSLVDWHGRHPHCSMCGAMTHMAKGGWQRNCTDAACGGEHFPRVDPVTIMLVEHDGNLLLGRQPRYPARRFSALAGFLEPGESMEEAVAREVFEEAGVRVRDVTYVASQPWPFPSSLMIGCHSFADDPALVIDTTELDDARWFSRDEVAYAMGGAEDGAFIAPPPFAVAHFLLKWWLAR